jgi:hypothetical protein
MGKTLYMRSRCFPKSHDLRIAVEQCFSRLKANLDLSTVQDRGIKRCTLISTCVHDFNSCHVLAVNAVVA